MAPGGMHEAVQEKEEVDATERFEKELGEEEALEAAAINLEKAWQELVEKRAVISGEYTIKNGDLISPEGYKFSGFLKYEDPMMREQLAKVPGGFANDPNCQQAVVVSPDFGAGRSYVYIYQRDANDPSKIHYNAVEFKGGDEELPFIGGKKELPFTDQEEKLPLNSGEEALTKFVQQISPDIKIVGRESGRPIYSIAFSEQKTSLEQTQRFIANAVSSDTGIDPVVAKDYLQRLDFSVKNYDALQTQEAERISMRQQSLASRASDIGSVTEAVREMSQDINRVIERNYQSEQNGTEASVNSVNESERAFGVNGRDESSRIESPSGVVSISDEKVGAASVSVQPEVEREVARLSSEERTEKSSPYKAVVDASEVRAKEEIRYTEAIKEREEVRSVGERKQVEESVTTEAAIERRSQEIRTEERVITEEPTRTSSYSSEARVEEISSRNEAPREGWSEARYEPQQTVREDVQRDVYRVDSQEAPREVVREVPREVTREAPREAFKPEPIRTEVARSQPIYSQATQFQPAPPKVVQPSRVEAPYTPQKQSSIWSKRSEPLMTREVFRANDRSSSSGGLVREEKSSGVVAQKIRSFGRATLEKVKEVLKRGKEKVLENRVDAKENIKAKDTPIDVTAQLGKPVRIQVQTDASTLSTISNKLIESGLQPVVSQALSKLILTVAKAQDIKLETVDPKVLDALLEKVTQGLSQELPLKEIEVLIQKALLKDGSPTSTLSAEYSEVAINKELASLIPELLKNRELLLADNGAGATMILSLIEKYPALMRAINDPEMLAAELQRAILQGATPEELAALVKLVIMRHLLEMESPSLVESSGKLDPDLIALLSETILKNGDQLGADSSIKELLERVLGESLKDSEVDLEELIVRLEEALRVDGGGEEIGEILKSLLASTESTPTYLVDRIQIEQVVLVLQERILPPLLRDLSEFLLSLSNEVIIDMRSLSTVIEQFEYLASELIREGVITFEDAQRLLMQLEFLKKRRKELESASAWDDLTKEFSDIVEDFTELLLKPVEEKKEVVEESMATVDEESELEQSGGTILNTAGYAKAPNGELETVLIEQVNIGSRKEDLAEVS